MNKRKKGLWLIQADSESQGRAGSKTWTTDDHPDQTAQFWADVSGERVSVYRCVPVKKTSPKIVFPQHASKIERVRLRKVAALKADLATASARFYALPKRGSFSGIHCAGEISRIQQELDALGDKGPRIHPEVNIEVG